jgi:hypothetical protein
VAFKDLYVSQDPKNPIVIPPALTRPGACAFTRDYEVYSSTLQLLLYPFNMGFTVFFCLSAGSVNEDKIFWFKLKTEEKGAAAKFVGVSC